MICAGGVLHASVFSASDFNNSKISPSIMGASDKTFAQAEPDAPVQGPIKVAPKGVGKKKSPNKSRIAGPTPLVPIDRDEEDWIKEADKAIADAKYDRAIKILQALVEKNNAGYYRLSPTLFKSISLKASQMIGKLPKQALEEYRLIYEPIADAKYYRAIKTGDLGLLREILVLYANTKICKKAQAALADCYFDQGKMLSAVRNWVKLGEFKTPEDAIRLVKIITALHLAGRDDVASKYIKKLNAKFPNQIANLAGKKQKLTDFVKQMMKVKPLTVEAVSVVKNEYLGVGGQASSIDKMAPLDVVLISRWRYPRVTNNPNLDVTDMMLAIKAAKNIESNNTQISGVSLEDGIVQLSVKRPESSIREKQGEIVMPALIQPTVWKNLVIFRDDKGVVALNIKTGEVVWKGELPIYKPQTPQNRYYYNENRVIFDTGKYQVSIGGGNVYAVGDFAPPEVNENNSFRGGSQGKPKSKSNMLAAFSLKNEGCIEWLNGGSIKPKSTGDKDVDEFMQQIEYLSAPAYVSQPGSQEGRLYVVANHISHIYLVCLNAADGSLIWRQSIGQRSVKQNIYGKTIDIVKRIACVPRYKDGKIYVQTNSGLISCFDAESGRPSWAYQYRSTRHPNVSGSPRKTRCSSVLNQIIISGKYLIAKPYDSNIVFVLDKNTGEQSYPSVGFRKKARGIVMEYVDQMLVGIDSKTVAVVGENIKFIDIKSGKVKRVIPSVHAYYGRPVLAGDSLLCVCKGYLLKVNIKNYNRETIQLDDSNGILGNMVCLENKLICANAAGVAAYFNFDIAYSMLTDHINAAKTIDQKLAARYKRAKLSRNAGKFVKAKADYDQAAEEIKGQTDSHVLQYELNNNYYNLYIAQGNNAKGKQAIKFYLLAEKYAISPAQEAQMKIRLAKCYASQKQYKKAVDTAVQVGTKYGKLNVVDVKIGKAGNNIRSSKKMHLITGKAWALDTRDGFIKKLIKKHGQGIYAKYDAKAKTALDAVKATGQPGLIEKIAQEYPLSKYADQASLLAAEEYYNKAGSVSEATRRAYLRNVNRLVDSVITSRGGFSEEVRCKDKTYLTAKVIKLVIKQNKGFTRSVSLDISEMEDYLDDSIKISFANIKGDIETVLENILEGKYKFAEVNLDINPILPTPLKFAYKLLGNDALILGNKIGVPIKLGDIMFAMSECKAYVLSPGANAKVSVKAVSNLNLPLNWKSLNGQMTGFYTANISSDGKNCIVSNRKFLTAFDITTGKVLWRTNMHKFVDLQKIWGRIENFNFNSVDVGKKITVAVSRRGEILAFDNSTGSLKWKVTTPLYGNGNSSLFVNDIELLDDCVLAVANNFKRYLAYSNETGKMVFDYDAFSGGSGASVAVKRNNQYVYHGNVPASYHVSKSGEIAILSKNKLTIFMLSGKTSVHKPVASYRCRASYKEKLVAFKDRYAVIAGPNKLSIFNTKTKSQADLLLPVLDSENPTPGPNIVGKPDRNGRGLSILSAVISNGDLYITASLRTYSSYHRSFKRYSSGAMVLKYRLQTGKLCWSKKLLSINENCCHLRLVVCSENIVFGVAPNYRTDNAGLYILSKKDGTVKQHIKVFDRQKYAKEQFQSRNNLVGRFAVQDSKIITEDIEGIKVFTSK